MKRITLNFKRNLILIALFLSVPAMAVEQSLLVAAQNMLNQGKSLDALELLEPFEEEYAGDREFDYLYGLALLDTGEPSNAIFAFQRALAVEPNFAGARLELARSYFDVGQMSMAQRELLLLQNQSPPDNVMEVIEQYLAAIENRNLSNRKGWRGFLQLGIGDDSNVNSATSADSFLGFTLADDSRETSSSVISTLGGARYDLPLNFDSKLFFKGSVNHRANNDASFATTVNYDLLAGYNKSFKNRNNFSAAIQTYTADVDGDFNNKGFNLTAQYNFTLSAVNQIGTFVRIGNVDYASEFDVKDIDQSLLGISWGHVFSGDTRLSLVVAAIVGQDKAVESDSPYGRDISGLRISLAYPITHRFNIFSTLGKSDSDYDSAFFDEADKRSDSLTDVSIGSSWRVNKNWLLRAVVSQTDNSSNVEIFDYDRSMIMFTARSEFLP
jgi:tetratricopeptide (TPR) repeat protein